MTNQYVLLSDVVGYGVDGNDLSPELTNTYIDWIGENEIIELSNIVACSGVPKNQLNSYY